MLVVAILVEDWFMVIFQDWYTTEVGNAVVESGICVPFEE